MSKIIEGLLYSESHEWVKVDGNIAIIGVSDFAQEDLVEKSDVPLKEKCLMHAYWVILNMFYEWAKLNHLFRYTLEKSLHSLKRLQTRRILIQWSACLRLALNIS